ncbi:DUF6542 domain-containing protein [Kitasatospora sp. A2-31]|uniref:DUF6542 domain-containing protein n=1 Tax=Kitasatospora sp. A2-31 TaxID=2916414 RepID=UPI001EEDD21C|nr:DUF6542 domain-containing protein [Kitasatospora sp. A2-31]MCG6499370.1 hypothetical protein [Kitasatospora sp. A2-31]
MEQSIRTQPPGPRRRPPNGASGAAVPGPGRAPETAGPVGAAAPASRLRPVAGATDRGRSGAARPRLHLPFAARSPERTGERGDGRPNGRLYGRRRTGRPTRLTAVGTGVAAMAATVAAAGLDRLLFGGLGVLFGVGYLVVCFQLAVRVRFADLLAAPISGPIAFAVALLLFGPVASAGVTAQVVALATGLALRAGWLFSGTGLAAVIVLARFVAQKRIHRTR